MEENKSCRNCIYGFLHEENLLAKKTRGMTFCKWLKKNHNILPEPVYKAAGFDIKSLQIDYISPFSECGGYSNKIEAVDKVGTK